MTFVVLLVLTASFVSNNLAVSSSGIRGEAVQSSYFILLKADRRRFRWVMMSFSEDPSTLLKVTILFLHRGWNKIGLSS